MRFIRISKDKFDVLFASYNYLTSFFNVLQQFVNLYLNMALREKQNVVISTQEQFLTKISTTKANAFKAEWNGLARPEKFACRAFKNEEARAEGEDNSARKNRYNSIECNDNERVLVDKSNYFHGNYIRDGDKKKLFIATQGPTHASIKDFWKVVLQEGTTVIVMLCEVMEEGIEDGKTVMKQKCAPYWPTDPKHPMKLGEFNITFKERISKVFIGNNGVQQTIERSILEITDAKTGKAIRNVTHLQHKSWPDLGVPEATAPIIDIYNKYITPSVAKNTPVIVHCSAGIGRTGCFIGAYYCFHLFKKSVLVSVESAVRTLRRMRGRSVQKASQYMFLHILLLELIEAETGKDLKKCKDKFIYLNKVIKEREAKNGAADGPGKAKK